jgi:hypothetical protein
VFATLLEPAAFAATFEERLALVQRLGGPYFTSDPEELRQARAVGLQAAYLIVDHEGRDLVAAVRGAVAIQPEIIAIRTDRLSAAQLQNKEEFKELAAALAAAEGFHRMIVAADSPIAPLSAAEWARLPAESLLIDPIGDPDAWRAAATLPGDCGLVLGLVPSPGTAAAAEPREVLLWGLRYAASLGGRGGARVGFTERPRSLSLPREQTVVDAAASERSVALLAELLRLTGASEATLRDELDPRSFSPAAQRLEKRRDG